MGTSISLNRLQIVWPIFLFAGLSALHSQSLDEIGVTALGTVTTNLHGAGIRVAQVEAETGTNLPPPFEVTPAQQGQSNNLFTYLSGAGTASTFPNSAGSDSAHADSVAGLFYGLGSGVATNLAHVDNYDVNFFIQGYVNAGNYSFNLPAANINDPVVNQSFIFVGTTTNEQAAIDLA